MESQKIRISQLPVGIPKADEDFSIETIKLPPLEPGEMLIEAEWISVDPYLRGKLPAWGVNAIMRSNQIACIVESRNSEYSKGEYVFGHFQWATRTIITAKEIDYRVPSDPSFCRSHYVGAYGMTGETAWYGLIEVAKLKHCETVFVSGAAGAVGSVVGQIAKQYNCFVVGICGSAAKCKYLTDELHFDVALNYKTFDNNSVELSAALEKAFDGKGIDVYYDNVGGFITASVWDLLNVRARVLICGQISNYNQGGNLGRLAEAGNPTVPKMDDFLYKLVYREIHVLGFLVNNFKDQRVYKKAMKQWIESGAVKARQTIVHGFEKIPSAFVGLFTGDNIGKMVVQCSGGAQQTEDDNNNNSNEQKQDNNNDNDAQEVEPAVVNTEEN